MKADSQPVHVRREVAAEKCCDSRAAEKCYDSRAAIVTRYITHFFSSFLKVLYPNQLEIVNERKCEKKDRKKFDKWGRSQERKKSKYRLTFSNLLHPSSFLSRLLFLLPFLLEGKCSSLELLPRFWHYKSWRRSHSSSTGSSFLLLSRASSKEDII